MYLDLMIGDMGALTGDSKPSAYWLSHSYELVSDLKTNGFENFRSSPSKSIRAFAGSSYDTKETWYRPRLWKLHKYITKVPGLGKLFKIYEQEIDREVNRISGQWKYKMRVMHQLLKVGDPTLLDIKDSLVGNPQTIEIEGNKYSESFLQSLIELYELETVLGNDFFHTAKIFEIGPGFGSFAEVLLKRYPKAKYCILDILPVLAFSQYYLTKAFPGEVVGYEESRDLRSLTDTVIESSNKRIWLMASSMLDRINCHFNLFINCASFQEMTVPIVKNYSEVVKKTCKTVYLNNCHADNKERPGLHSNFYKDCFDPMSVQKEWQNFLMPGYRKLLLQSI